MFRRVGVEALLLCQTASSLYKSISNGYKGSQCLEVVLSALEQSCAVVSALLILTCPTTAGRIGHRVVFA